MSPRSYPRGKGITIVISEPEEDQCRNAAKEEKELLRMLSAAIAQRKAIRRAIKNISK